MERITKSNPTSFEARESQRIIAKSVAAFYILFLCILLVLWWQTGPYISLPQLIYYGFCFALVAIVLPRNLQAGIFEDEITIGALLLGLAARLLLNDSFFPEVSAGPLSYNLVDGLWGALLGGGILYIGGISLEWIFKNEQMGGGDVKLAGALGAFLGGCIFWYAFAYVAVLLFLQILGRFDFFKEFAGEITVIPSAALHGYALAVSMLGISLKFNSILFATFVLGISAILILSRNVGIVEEELASK